MNTISMVPVERKKSLDNTVFYNGWLTSFLVTAEDTGGRFAVVEFEGRPGGEPPMHIHQYEDEFIYVLEGAIAAMVGGKLVQVRAGESVFFPRTVPHTFRLKTPSARAMVMISPAGFEDFFRELSSPATSLEVPEPQGPPTPDRIEQFVRTAERYGISFTPEQPSF